jgi:hypothetical protein
MPRAICCGEPDGAGGAGGADGDGDADGAGPGDADADGDGADAGCACCACCWAAAAAARRSARLRAAARRAAASRAASARLCCRRRADWLPEIRTCGGSSSLPPSRRPAPACCAEPAVSESAVDTPGVLPGQSATTPEATAAVTTVEPVATMVIFEGLLCMGVLRRRCIRDKMSPWSGARRALGFHPLALPRRRARRRAGSGAATLRGSGRRVARGNRHARWVLSANQGAAIHCGLMPEQAQNPV